MASEIVVEVKLWGKTLGAVAESTTPGVFQFEYDASFPAQVAPAPLMMKRGTRRTFAFPNLSDQTYHGLPGMLADALPDRFGNSLIDAYMARQGIALAQVTALQRLLYVGQRGMGALEFQPAIKTRGPQLAHPLQMASLVEDARKAIRGEFSEIAQDIIDVGSSAGGARAKAVIGWKPSGSVLSGQFDLPPGYEHWLLKFDVGIDHQLGYSQGFGRTEYAHYLMAQEAGIEMSPCRLLEEGGRAHFMTKRFDRIGNDKLHVQTLCALAHLDFNQPQVHSYEQYLRTCLEMELDAPQLTQAWMRAAFNFAICNCDDHTKNLAFVMQADGSWQLAPAYDLAFAHNPAPGKWTRLHQMSIAGKNWDVSMEDLLNVAKQFGITGAKEKMQLIVDATRRWPKFAQSAGMQADEIERIAKYRPDWANISSATSSIGTQRTTLNAQPPKA